MIIKRVYKWKVNVHFSVGNIIGVFFIFHNKRNSLVSNNREGMRKINWKYLYIYIFIYTLTKKVAKVNYKLYSYQWVCQTHDQINNKYSSKYLYSKSNIIQMVNK